jgi:hypothetical protein
MATPDIRQDYEPHRITVCITLSGETEHRTMGILAPPSGDGNGKRRIGLYRKRPDYLLGPGVAKSANAAPYLHNNGNTKARRCQGVQ